MTTVSGARIVSSELKEKIISTYIVTAPGRNKLFASMIVPLQYRISDLSQKLSTNREYWHPERDADWSEYESYDFQAEDLVKMYNRALPLMAEEEREQDTFRQVRVLLGDWHRLTDEAKKRAQK